MGDFKGSAVQPFTDFLKLGDQKLANAAKASSSRKDDAEREGLKKERVRREKMAELFSELQLLVPTHDRIEKKTRETIVDEAIEYLKFLEEEKRSLEDLKRVKEMGASSKQVRVLAECSNRSVSSVNVCVSNGVAFFGIELPSKRGLVTQVFRVFERNQAEVLAANIGTNDQHFLRLTATLLLLKIGSNSIEKIKREIQSL